MLEQVTKQVREALEANGWALTPEPFTAIAKRSIATAVGEKEAFVYLENWSKCGTVVLNACYWSEGRNAVSTVFQSLPLTADKSECFAIAKRFTEDALQAISETYAVRLLKAA